MHVCLPVWRHVCVHICGRLRMLWSKVFFNDSIHWVRVSQWDTKLPDSGSLTSQPLCHLCRHLGSQLWSSRSCVTNPFYPLRCFSRWKAFYSLKWTICWLYLCYLKHHSSIVFKIFLLKILIISPLGSSPWRTDSWLQGPNIVNRMKKKLIHYSLKYLQTLILSGSLKFHITRHKYSVKSESFLYEEIHFFLKHQNLVK